MLCSRSASSVSRLTNAGCIDQPHAEYQWPRRNARHPSPHGQALAGNCWVAPGGADPPRSTRCHPKEAPMPAAVRNVAREKLELGNLSLGVGIRMTRSVEIAKAMAVAGFDWLFLDMEHGVMSLEACAQISTAALDAGIAPIARLQNGEYPIATRALNNGALGIVMPHVDTAGEAREFVNRLKYPPVGHRSMGGIGRHYGLRSASSGEAAA